MSIDYQMLLESDRPLEQVRHHLEENGLGASREGMFLTVQESTEPFVLRVPDGERGFVSKIFLRAEINSFDLKKNKDEFLQNVLTIWSFDQGSIVLLNAAYAERPLVARTEHSVWINPIYESYWRDLPIELSNAGISFLIGSIELDL